MFKKKEEEIKHEVTEEEVIENNLEGVFEAGEEVIIPAEEEVIEEEVIAEEPKAGYRECTCGALVPLPMEGEEPTVCECGVKHVW